jgi:hypothetical protein
MKGSWYSSVTEHRFRVIKDLEDNPSFQNYIHDIISKAYVDARKLAIKESKNANPEFHPLHQRRESVANPLPIDYPKVGDMMSRCII